MNNENSDLNPHSLKEVTDILRQFVESSTFGDFHIRVELLKSFELFLHICSIDNINKKNNLIYSLHSLGIYFNQFSKQIVITKRNIRVPIEKKLKEFVKIESYNKDLSYFSMRNNIAKVHRNLNKFLKEYEKELNVKITTILKTEVALDEDLKFKQFQPQLTIDHFITPSNEKFIFIMEPYKLCKYFSSSRRVAEAILKSTKYTECLEKFNEVISEQIGNYEYLSGLKVS